MVRQVQTPRTPADENWLGRSLPGIAAGAGKLYGLAERAPLPELATPRVHDLPRPSPGVERANWLMECLTRHQGAGERRGQGASGG